MSHPDLAQKRAALLLSLSELPYCVVAFSAGVDSAVVAKAAHLALSERAVAVTAVSPSLASGELHEAVHVAELIGIRHQIVHTTEVEQPAYQQNDLNRCYFCKSELYSQLEVIAAAFQDAIVLNGANVDDVGDYRPGMRAASEHQVRSPLLECGLTKAEVRELAREWGLPIWDKPATPCLSSRIAYGEEVTPARLRMIDAAEAFLREQGLRELRVRYHRGDVARIEVLPSALVRFADVEFRQQVSRRFHELGFRFVSLDLDGLKSGGLNVLIQPSLPQRPSQ